jgi:hypothetical protein
VDFPAAKPNWLARPTFSKEKAGLVRGISGLPDDLFALIGEAFSWPRSSQWRAFLARRSGTIDCEDGQRTIEPKGKGHNFPL